jgi:hypothetical protein
MASHARSDDLFDIEGVAELYGVDPSEFVAARALLVKRLKADGDTARAGEVAKLRKPSVVAAAINRVARRRADDIDRLVTASEALADAQRAALLGGDAAELRAAAADRRRLLADVAADATAEAGAAKAAEVSATVEAALADDALVTDLRRGTLVDTLSAPAGFGFGLADDDGPLAPAPSAARATRSRKGSEAEGSAVGNPDWAAEEKARRKADREARRRAEARLATARKALDQGEQELRDAEAELGAAHDAVARARERVNEATGRCDSLSAAVDEAASQLAELSDG